MSYQELIYCQAYADRVLNLYKKCNGGKVPKTASDAELAVTEYNKECKSLKSLYGLSIKKYLPIIVDLIGYSIEN